MWARLYKKTRGALGIESFHGFLYIETVRSRHCLSMKHTRAAFLFQRLHDHQLAVMYPVWAGLRFTVRISFPIGHPAAAWVHLAASAHSNIHMAAICGRKPAQHRPEGKLFSGNAAVDDELTSHWFSFNSMMMIPA